MEEIKLKDGQILRLDPTGKMEYGEFKPQESYYCSYDFCVGNADDYLEELKAVALSLGYDPSIIDTLWCERFSVDEIEDFLYT